MIFDPWLDEPSDDGDPVRRDDGDGLDDPLDGADFSIVQDAVDASFESGSRIEIFPGLGPYYESVRLDRHQVYSILGLDDGPLGPVIVDGGSGPAFQAVNKIGSAPMAFSWMTLRGFQGVRSSVDLHLDRMVFEMIGAKSGMARTASASDR